jgi:hypothetical protein
MASKNLTITCSENVALLYLLHSVPTQPSSNPIKNELFRRNGYYLPFERELSLISTLAFLSSINDDSEHIPAVCVQQSAKPAHLSVLLAVNKTKPGDGNQILQKVKEGFERIFSIISLVQKGELPNPHPASLPDRFN